MTNTKQGFDFRGKGNGFEGGIKEFGYQLFCHKTCQLQTNAIRQQCSVLVIHLTKINYKVYFGICFPNKLLQSQESPDV